METNSPARESLNIILVCPGATEWDAQERIVGNLDVPLSADGEAQIRRAAEKLRDIPFQRIYAAPGTAGEATARALANGGHVRIRFDDRLANMDFGLWQGKRLEELKATFPKQFKKWQDIPRSLCPPNGETLDDVAARAQQFLKWLTRKHRDGSMVVVVAEPMASIMRNVIMSEPIGTDWHMMGQQANYQQFELKPNTELRPVVSSGSPIVPPA